MNDWAVVGLIALAGAIGGIANALSTDNAFPLPQPLKKGDRTVAWQAGVIGNVFTAAVAALVSWGLYGPATNFVIAGEAADGAPTTLSVTIGALATALLIGYGGARWLTNEFDKRILKAAASAAASTPADDSKATRIANASPAEAFRIATE